MNLSDSNKQAMIRAYAELINCSQEYVRQELFERTSYSENAEVFKATWLTALRHGMEISAVIAKDMSFAEFKTQRYSRTDTAMNAVAKAITAAMPAKEGE